MCEKCVLIISSLRVNMICVITHMFLGECSFNQLVLIMNRILFLSALICIYAWEQGLS